jgi:hypothetical protein
MTCPPQTLLSTAALYLTAMTILPLFIIVESSSRWVADWEAVICG